MGLQYQLFTSDVGVSLQTLAAKVVVPVCESLKVVEYGFATDFADPAATGVMALQYVDGAGNVVTLDSFTGPAAAGSFNVVSQRVDVLIDKLLDRYVVSVSGTPGTITEETDGFSTVRVAVTTSFGVGVQGIVYLKAAMCGTPKGPATNQVLVTAI